MSKLTQAINRESMPNIYSGWIASFREMSSAEFFSEGGKWNIVGAGQLHKEVFIVTCQCGHECAMLPTALSVCLGVLREQGKAAPCMCPVCNPQKLCPVCGDIRPPGRSLLCQKASCHSAQVRFIHWIHRRADKEQYLKMRRERYHRKQSLNNS